MACDFYLLIYPYLLSWVIRKQANCVTTKQRTFFLMGSRIAGSLTYSHAADNGVTRLSNRSGCDQPPKRPPALKKKRSKAGHRFYNNDYLRTPVLGLCINRVAQKERMFFNLPAISFFGVTSNQKSTFENLVQSTIWKFPFANKLQLCHKKC